MTLIYSLTIFLSAFLLFLIQPMIGKSLLPLFGGTPAVWNVCLVFFQALLVAGYTYANFIVKIKSQRHQILGHLFIFGLVIAFTYFNPLYVVSGGDVLLTGTPIFSLFSLLLKRVGVPFFLLSSTSTILQSWYGQAQKSKRNPYFLYSASNLGSLLSLLVFPLFVEPNLGVSKQFYFWQILFLLLFGLMVLASFFVSQELPTQPRQPEVKQKVPMRTRRHWFILAFIPSGLLIATNTYIATEVASIPLLWMLPLSLFLLTFSIAFSNLKFVEVLKKAEPRLYRFIAFLTAVVLVGIIYETFVGVEFIVFHVLLFFMICLQFHLELSKTRPAVDSLSQFYLIISLGGVCGGIFSSLIAPLIFNGTIEYPLLIATAIFCSCFSNFKSLEKFNWRDLVLSLGLFLVSSVFCYYCNLEAEKNALMVLLNVGLLAAPIFFAYAFLKNRRRYAVLIFSIFLANYFFNSQRAASVVFRSRSFYGTLKVVDGKEMPFVKLYHGTTLHGLQSKIEAKKNQPLSYYSELSPISQIFEKLRNANSKLTNVGVVGLGTGSLSAYATPQESWDYFELDPTIIAIAQDLRFFSFLKLHSDKSKLKIYEGDARLNLQSIQNAKYDLLIIDAFSSDSIPTHLLTTEALALYLQKLKPDGALVLHISNRYFNFVPLLNSLAKSFQKELLVNYYVASGEAAARAGINSSRWSILSNDKILVKSVLENPGWKMNFQEFTPLWTDDFSSLLGLLRFGK